MALITLPLNIDFFTWTSQLHIDLPNISVPIAADIVNWREWAAQLITDNTLSYVPIPSIIAYPNSDDWKIWATYFVDSVYNNN